MVPVPVTSIVPSNRALEAVTSPLVCKWNCEELISMLPFEPLTNCEPFYPKKNFGVSNVIELPLICASCVCIDKDEPSNFRNPLLPSPT